MSGKKYYGFHYGCHDANVTILDENGNLELYAPSERFNPRHKGSGHLQNFKNFFPKPDKKDLICVHHGFTDTIETEGFNNNDVKLVKKFIKGNLKNHFEYWLGYEITPTFVVAHHLCHILTSWAFRPNNDLRFCMGCDGSGSYADGTTSSCIGGFINEDGFKLVQLISHIYSSSPLCEILGNGSTGKAMGASGYFDEEKNNLNKNQLVEFINVAFLKQMPSLNTRPNFPNFQLVQKHNEKNALTFSAIFYNTMIEEIWKCCEINLQHFILNKNIGIVVGGGTHLALELNTKISSYAKDFVFGPPVNDSGISLGAAMYGYFLDTGKWPPALTTPSITFLQEPLPQVGPQEPKEIAKLIASNKVIGLLRGKAECGPRALGFRSILADAGKYENLKRVSQELKGREYYRPLAPMVTAESFDRYFIGPKGEYMQYKCDCTEEAQLECPAIVHKDNSSRPQVVYKEKDPWLHELLIEYGKLTGSECLINTSLNGPGKPICNTYNDALEDFKDKDIELVSIKN